MIGLAPPPHLPPSPVSSATSASSGVHQDLGLFAGSLLGLVVCLVVSAILVWGLLVLLRWAMRQDEVERWHQILRTLDEEDEIEAFREELKDL